MTCKSEARERYQSREESSGRVGISLRVTVSQIWMDYTMKTAIQIAKSCHIAVPCIVFSFFDNRFTTVIDPFANIQDTLEH